MPWQRTGLSERDVSPGGMREALVEGSPVLLVHPVNDRVYATAGRCTHKGGILAEGKLAGSQVTCPRHHSVFDVKTGTALKGPYGLLKTGNLHTLQIKIEDGEIWVDVPGLPV